MTKEIINSDGSRNWQANILLDNIKRLEKENFALTQESQQKSQTICELEQDIKQLTQWFDEARNNVDFWCNKCTILEQENKELKKQIESQKGLITEGGKQQCEMTMAYDRYKSALEEIKKIIDGHASPPECEYYGSYKNACEPCALRLLKQTEGKILDKINEVLG